MNRLLIQGGFLFDPLSDVEGEGDVLIRGDHILSVGAVERRGDEQVVEAHGLWVFPGLVDLHVHLREPGQEHKETIASGTAAAAAGGFTIVVAEPNTVPPRDTPARIAEVKAIAQARGVVEVMHKCCITVGQRGAQVCDLAALRGAGAVAASDDGFSVRDAGVMKEALAAAKAARMPLTLHVDGPEMVERDIMLSSILGWPVHFSHVSLAAEVDLIARAQARGLPVSGEATPHHLMLCQDEAPADDPNFRMSPPLRSAADREALRKGLAAGVISTIASDHAPHTKAEKAAPSTGSGSPLGVYAGHPERSRGAAPLEEAPSGVIGLETTLGVIWSGLVHESLLSAGAALAAMTTAPARALGVEVPALREGARADVTLFDPEHEWVVDPDRFRSRSRNCPFAGWRLRGKAVATIAGGRLVMWEGMLMAL
jgi:dihydroorotase